MRVADTTSIASRIEQAFQTASTSTGTSFDYLVKTAARESSFQPAAQASASTATGLFQFVEQTWLETVKESGAQHGLEAYAAQIERTASGRYAVADPQMRQEILDLRKNPEISSLMAGALTQKNAGFLQERLGRPASDGELYIAHFLGAQGATRLITGASVSPDARADAVFPAQAKANRAIFYERDGSPRSLSEVYANLVGKHENFSLIANASTVSPPAAKPAPTAVLAFSDEASQRVDNAFRATDTNAPFEALFRTEGTETAASMDASFLSAFASVPEGRPFDRAVGGSRMVAQVTGNSFAQSLFQDGGPLDLTGFLSYRERDEGKDLMPPV
ncbi:transglycosylase SLT domain-containing protein [Microvirga tunisiensis]|uniref:Transglycosylase SLT domain-containing protein n=1 Tax=Pannonibacter tanglangensis TaxID=2750084 RepID=A0A7X5F030_9HYPH|nr:transglycosylase SLT domain-containing protein [Pannonibacter sp. XCT-53]NBN77288.1 transglycosylase SLT domain-containing protein [Pannonibacter sp. XCT-53]